jgi:hypothetical protein
VVGHPVVRAEIVAMVSLASGCLSDVSVPECLNSVECGAGSCIDGRCVSSGGDASIWVDARADVGSSEKIPPDAADAGGADAFDVERDSGQSATLTIEANGGRVVSSPNGIDCGAGADMCSSTFAAGARVTLTATSGPSFGFAGWRLACEGAAPEAVVIMDSDQACSADFLQLEGAVRAGPPPISVLPGRVQDSAYFVFRERIDVQPAAPIALDAIASGTYLLFLGPRGSVSDARVDAYLLHLDPQTPDESTLTATVVFPREVIGIQVLDDALDRGDSALGLSQVGYPTRTQMRGFELWRDALFLAGDRRTMMLKTQLMEGFDQIRVITVARGEEAPLVKSDNVSLIEAPPSVRDGAIESNASAILFEERSVTLTSSVQVDVSRPGIYSMDFSTTRSAIPSGTAVRSWLIHFDPSQSVRTWMGVVFFDRPVLGVIARNGSLDASDPVLGSPSTIYSTGSNPRGPTPMEDAIGLAADGRSVSFTLSGSTFTELRVVVRGP